MDSIEVVTEGCNWQKSNINFERWTEGVEVKLERSNWHSFGRISINETIV